MLASLGSTINLPSEKQKPDFGNTGDTDNDSDTELIDDSKAEAIKKRIEMLNEEHRVQGILLSVEQMEDPFVMQSLCQLCHNLLITNKNAIHKYKLLYMLALKPLFLRQLWNNLFSASQKSIFYGSTPYLQIISRGLPLSPEETSKIVPLMAVFC